MPPHRPGKVSSESSFPFLAAVGVGFRRFLAFISRTKNSNKPPATWRRSLTRCLLFFLSGLLVGMTPFGHVNDLRTHDFSFEIKPPLVNTQIKVKTDYFMSRDDTTLDGDVNHRVQLQGDIFGLKREVKVDFEARKQLIVVTPTYNRAMQAYFMNRVGQVLRLVKPPLLWIVVEMNAASVETAEILRNTRVMYKHLVSSKNMTNVKDRGVHQRNTALEHIQLHRLDGIVYFADDDNIYSLELFENLRRIRYIRIKPFIYIIGYCLCDFNAELDIYMSGGYVILIDGFTVLENILDGKDLNRQTFHY